MSTGHPSSASRRVPLAAPPWRAGALAAAVAAVVVGTLLTVAPRPAARAQADTWRPVLDGLYGDRVAALALVGPASQVSRPLLILPADQGLFRSTDGARTWSPVAVDPQRSPSVVLTVARAGSDDAGRVLYAGLRNPPLLGVSDDGGATWSTRPGPAGASRFDRVAVARTGQILAADRSQGLVWTSADQGDTWSTQTLADAGIAGRVDDIFAAPDDPVVYLVAGGALYRSTDVPGQWQAVLGPAGTPAATVSHAAVGPRGRLYAVARGAAADVERLFASEDRGDTWPFGGWPSPAPAAGTARALTAGEVGENLPAVWLAFESGEVYQSDDKGAGWTRLRTLPAPPTLVAFDPASREVWVGTDGLGLFRAAPGWGQFGAVPVEALALAGATYNLDRQVFLNARIRPSRRDGGVVRPALHGLYASVGGDTWARVDSYDVLGTNLLASPDFKRDRRLFSGRVVSHDAGLTWSPLGAAPGGAAPYVAAVGPMTGTHPVLYGLGQPYDAGGTDLVRSEDGGQSWVATDATVGGIAAVVVSPAYVEERVVYLATDRGVVFKAVDGLSFEQVGRIAALTPERVLYDLVISPRFRNDQTLLAAVEDTAGAARAAMFISIDGGKTWTRRADNLPGNARPRTLVLSPSFSSDRVVFMAGERRTTDPALPTVFGSDAAGISWYPEATLPPGAYVRSLLWGGTLAAGRLFAAAGPAGVWVRTLDGAPEPGPTPTPGPVTPTATREPTPSPTPTASAMPTASLTPGGTPPSATPTADAPTPAATATASGAPPDTATPSPTATSPATATATDIATATDTATPTTTATPPATATPARRPAYLPLAWQRIRR